MAEMHAVMPNEMLAPVWRALMRVESELLMHDADLVTATAEEPRTPDQRRADALVALILRAAEQAA